MPDVTTITDINGVVRRCGSMPKPAGFVSAMPTFASAMYPWTDAMIAAAIKHPERKLGRKLFGPRWTHDQLSVSSCNGWSASGCYSRARYLRGFTDEWQASGSWLYSLINRGSDNGSILEDALKVGMSTGFASLALVGPSQIYPQLQPMRQAATVDASHHKSFRAFAINTKQEFRTALAAGFPVSVAVHAGGRFQTLDSRGVSGADNGGGNHAVLCDDIVILDDGTEVYDHQNSWGLRYGQQGRSYLTWDSFAQTFDNHQFYAIASTAEFDG